MKLKDRIHSLVIAKNSHYLVEFLRYFLVAVISLATDIFLLYVLTSLAGIYYLVSAIFSYIFGMIVNYLLSTYWVFAKRKLTNRVAEFLVFAGIGLMGLAINELLLWALTGILLIHYMISRILSAGIGYVWKYFARKYFLFR